MHSFRKLPSLILVLAVVLGSTLASARSLQDEMKWLLSLVRSVQAVATLGEKTPTDMTDERLDSTLEKFTEIQATLVRVATTQIPQAAAEVPEKYREDFVAKFKQRLADLGKLMEVFEQELRAQRGQALEARSFVRASKIAKQITECKNRAHDDFMNPTLTEAMHQNVCTFVD